jgi:regulator of nucleoside diphosphate kinase
MIAQPPGRPPIVLSQSDHRTLERLAIDTMLEAPRVAGALLDEVDRASVVRDRELSAFVVRLGCRVVYLDHFTGERHAVRVVARPSSACSEEEVSVLSPVGSALIGLAVNQSIVCEDRVGSRGALTVLAVSRLG